MRRTLKRGRAGAQRINVKHASQIYTITQTFISHSVSESDSDSDPAFQLEDEDIIQSVAGG